MSKQELSVKKQIIKIAETYSRYRNPNAKVNIQPTLIVYNGEEIPFFEVGRNSSHWFYLGEKDGKIYHRSCTYDENTDTAISQIKEITSINAHYIGHF